MAKSLNTLDVPSATAWRSWLAEHHASVREIWLVFHKRHTGRPTIAYTDAVDEALCFGWVDSLIRRLDEDRYARKFTPRKADSAWSTTNRRRYAALLAAGRLTEAGLARSPTAKSGDAPQLTGGKVPTYIQRTLRKHPAARKFFECLAPSHQRAYLVWIDSAKREETKLKRLQQALQMLAAGRKPGMK
jgi:uncharacterized protein YdeI (YjbR/CyaY-like superfamily)